MRQLMRLHFLVDVCSADGTYEIDKVYDVPDTIAIGLIKRGDAEVIPDAISEDEVAILESPEHAVVRRGPGRPRKYAA